MKYVFSRRIALTCVLFILTLLSACVTSSGNYGKLRYDNQVKQTFENFEVLPGYDYYFYGAVSFPSAFVGISKEFTLDSALWKPIDLTSKDLHNWIWRSANRTKGDLNRYGSNIIGPNNEHIGVWYSLRNWQQTTNIELGEDGSVRIGKLR